MKKGKANLVIDGQWGSTGKGKLAGYLASTTDIQAAVCDFMPNAGHTFVHDDGRPFITCQLPTSVVNQDCTIIIGPAAVINIDKLFQEIEEHHVENRLLIHPFAGIVTDADRTYEADMLTRISSTLKGGGSCAARKMMRSAKTAKDEPRLNRWIADTTNTLHKILINGGTILVESAQGFDLSLNHGYQYPCVTSRDITPMGMLSNAGIPHVWLGDIYGSIRTYPIRVGNVMDEQGTRIGYSGPCYNDQDEVTWDYLKECSGYEHSIEERTTVTNKVRRVFTFSFAQLDKFIETCAPNKIFLNFINHINAKDEGVQETHLLSKKSLEWVHTLQKHLIDLNEAIQWNHPIDVVMIGTGRRNCDMVIL